MPLFEFKNWAVIALGGIPDKTAVGMSHACVDMPRPTLAATSTNASPPRTDVG